jgi:endonuclease YncB( thermonuclease family)
MMPRFLRGFLSGLSLDRYEARWVSVIFFGYLLVWWQLVNIPLPAEDAPVAPVAPARVRVRVLAVHDGDTVRFEPLDPPAQADPLGHAGPYNARLLGIDAPELGQFPWGDAARLWLESQLVRRNDVQLELDPAVPTDKYGRVPAYLLVGTGDALECLNEKEVGEGWAYAYNPGRPLARGDDITRAEKSARTHKRGIWRADPPLTSPSEYRKKK